jgi:beta-lactam-binding protein with PASTA domain
MRPRRRRSSLRLGVTWRRFFRDIAIVAAVFALGYVISAVWISPAPLFGTRDHSTPRVLGRNQTDARQELTALGFKPRVSGSRAHPTAGAGVVIWQDPPPGVVLSPNSAVTLVVSAGPMPVPVPDIVGLDIATARRILTAAGLKVGDIESVTARREPGVVVATRPAVGSSRRRGARVGLVVSRPVASRSTVDSNSWENP